ncbi:hypothetical protein [Ruminococcus sp.]|uniref:hypothetical protein n=1 Tax=Ruminococcus sp. TaxID=41978 RepID=UPI003F0F08D4
MKCPNCGYNCDDKYCAMCGTKMPEQPVNTNPNPYESAPVNNNFQPENFSQTNNADFNTDFGNPNPYNQPQAPVNNANPFQNDFQSGAPNMPQGGMPVPPAYPAPPQYSNAPKKKSKALPIVLTCLIAAVIVAGAVISVYSACTYNQSIITDLFKDNSNDDDYYDYYLDDEYYPDTKYIDDVETHKTGETKELSDCKITLTKFERDKSADENKTGNSRTKFVFEVENTTDENITLIYIYCDATDADGNTSLDWLSNNLENDDIYSDFISLEPNEKKELIFEYSVPNDAEKIRLDLSFTNNKNAYDYRGTFVTE